MTICGRRSILGSWGFGLSRLGLDGVLWGWFVIDWFLNGIIAQLLGPCQVPASDSFQSSTGHLGGQ